MTRNLLLSLVSIGLPVLPVQAGEMHLGDGRIDGARIAEYTLTWRQCSFQDGSWQARGDLTEEFAILDDATARIRQTVEQPNGTVFTSDVYVGRDSFSPVKMETVAVADGVRVAHTIRHLDADGYNGSMTRGGETTELEGVISSSMLHGGGMGLPLATLDYQSEPLEFVASMVSFDATYRVVAEWVGREKIEFDGTELEAWLIDVEWHHRESGDVYPPGPDASGGRYWVVRDAPPGFPHVPRYQTDTYAVEFIEDVCPR